MKTFLLLLISGVCFGQGWSALPNTVFNNNNVCIPDNFGTGSGMPAFSWRGFCHYAVDGWNGAAVDTLRNRVTMFGNGHSETPGNEVYIIDMTSRTASTKGASSASGYPVVQRLTDPSVFSSLVTAGGSACNTANIIVQADGSPVARHTYDSLVYLPIKDVVFSWAGSDMCNTQQDQNIALFHPGTGTWELKYPTGGMLGSGGSHYNWAHCDLDPTQSQESVVCIGASNSLWRWNSVTNVSTALVGYGQFKNHVGAYVNGGSLQTGGTSIMDPDHQIFFLIGGTFEATWPAGTGRVFAIDMTTSPPAVEDWTSTVVAGGCPQAALDVNYPGVAWDSALHKVAIYPTTGNSVYLLDPVARTCQTRTYTGGPTASAAMIAQGMFRHFSYIPALNQYVVMNNVDQNAYTLTLGLPQVPAINGLGASTLTCVDRDGDTYGTGPGCAGPDADDEDATVHTSAQMLAKWGSFNTFLSARTTYAPTHKWFVAPTGNDSTGVVDDIAHPFATCCGSGKANPAASDMIVMRDGAYTFRGSPPSGTSSGDTIIMAYPGELPTWSTTPTGWDFQGATYVTLDGMKCAGCDTSAWLRLEPPNYVVGLAGSHHITIRNVDSSGNVWNLLGDTTHDVLVEYSTFHDDIAEHGIYFANHDGYNSPTADTSANYANNITIRRSLFWNYSRDAVHVNGRFDNVVVEQNVFYAAVCCEGSPAVQLQSGVRNSKVRDNLFFNNRYAIGIDSYQGWCTAFQFLNTYPCPYGQTGNLIENNTVYTGNNYADGTAYAAYFGAIKVSNADAATVDQGHNTFRNNIVVSYTPSGFGYPSFSYDSASVADVPTSTFTNNLVWSSYPTPGTAAFWVGSSYLTCAQMTATYGSGVITGCNFANPNLVAASPTYYNTPASFDLHLNTGSPAIATGSTNTATYDVRGTMWASPSDIGALKYGIGSSCTISTTSLPNATIGIAYSQTLVQSSCATSTWGSSGLGSGACTGLTISSSTGAITGTPTTSGTCTFTVTYDTTSRPLTIAVNGTAASGVTGTFTGTGRNND